MTRGLLSGAVLRILALALLALPLTPLYDRLTAPPPSSVLVVDDSPSMERRYPGLPSQLPDLWAAGPSAQSPVVYAGGAPPSGETLPSLLIGAASLFERSGEKRILLASDGLIPSAGLDYIVSRLQENDISVYGLNLPPPQRQSGALSLHAPEQAWISEPFIVRGIISSTSSSAVDITFSRDGQPLQEARVVLDPWGRGTVEFMQESDRVGTVSFSLSADDQPYPPALTSVRIASSPRVRYIVEDPETARGLIAIFRSAGIELTVSRTSDLSRELTTFENDDVIVLDNPSALDVSSRLVDELIAAVSSGGKGLVVLGGRNGLGSEEFRRSRLGAILPVVSGYTSPPAPPPVSLVIAMDTSFSMHMRGRGKKVFHSNEPRKIDVAKEAAKEIVRIIRPRDSLGLMGNSTELFWIHELGPLGNRRQVLERIDGVKPKGDGLNFYSIVHEAYQRLLRESSPIRHILVLGDSEDIDEYEVAGAGHSYDLLREMARKGVTLSVVALGQPTDKDVPFLRTASLLGQGDFYQVPNITALPQYFVSEYRKLSSQQYLEDDINTRIGDSTPLLHGVDTNLPPLEGISLVTPRDGSVVPVRTDTGIPLVTTGTLGAGRVAVFASDNGYRWAGRWLSWGGADTFWTQVLFAVAPDRGGGLYSSSLEVDRPGGLVAYNIRMADGALPGWKKLWLHLLGEGRPAVPLVRSGLTEYSARGHLPETGLYRIVVSEEEAGEKILHQAEIWIPPSLEELPFRGDRPLLNGIVEATGGRWVDDVDEIAAEKRKNPLSYATIYTLTVALGLSALFAEAALTYFLRR